jgi:hypothetical protein
MMGSGVRISLAAPVQVLIGQTGGQLSKFFATTSFSASRRSSEIAPKLTSASFVNGTKCNPRACASLAVDHPLVARCRSAPNVSPACPASSTQFRLGAKPPAVAGREVRPTTRARTAVLAKCPRRHQCADAAQLRPLCPIRFSPDRKRTHSLCYIPTTKSGAAPHRPPPQFPLPK